MTAPTKLVAPTVSVVIPTYNRSKMLVEAVESALQQTRPPDEIIVTDDGSTDDTEQVVARYGGKLRYIQQENSGPAAARNNGIRKASGDFIAFLDSDDLWVKDRLERQFAALEQYPELDFIFGLEAKFTAEQQFDGCEIKDRNVWEKLNSVDCVVPEPFKLLLEENFIPTSSVLFRKQCIATVGFIDESLQQAEDYDLWLRFASYGCRFGFVNSVLCCRRQHGGNLVNQWVNRTSSTAAVLSRYCDHSPVQRERIARRLSDLYYDLGSALLYQRDFDRALHYLRLASPSGHTRLVWSAKLALARLLCR